MLVFGTLCSATPAVEEVIYSTVVYVITVGADRPVNSSIFDANSAALTWETGNHISTIEWSIS